MDGMLMTKALKEKWIENLRLGKYDQCRSRLRGPALPYGDAGTSFDPIGILCHTIDPDGWRRVKDRWEWRGVSSFPPLYLTPQEAGKLTYWSLSLGYTFKRIADLIEAGELECSSISNTLQVSASTD